MTSFIGGEFAGSSGGDTPGGPAGGDLSGTYPNPTVAKIQGNPVLAQVLGASQDGYVLTWVNSAGKIEAQPISAGEVPWATPGTIGSTTPNTGNFTTLVATLIEGNTSTGLPLSYLITNIVLSSTTYTLSNTDAAARYVRFSGTPGGAVTITMPTSMASGVSPAYDIYNGTNQAITISPGITSIPAGLKGTFYYDGVHYVPNGTIIGGDLTGITASSQVVTQISGSGTTNDYGLPGATVNIIATETIFNSASATSVVPSFTGTITTTNATPTTIAVRTPPNNTLSDYAVSITGLDASYDGYFYRGDLNFTVWNAGGSPVMYPASPSASNVRSNGTGSSYVISASISGSTIVVQVTGIAATTIHWAIAGMVIRST